MASENYDVQGELGKWFSGARRIVVAGIGNPIRMDDFVGVKIVHDLQDHVPKEVLLIECETVPESFSEEIVAFRPSHILLVDAAFLGLSPGSARLVRAEQLEAFQALSTHMLPLRIFCDYLAEMTKAAIGLLLVEPKCTDFGEGLTAEVEASARQLTGKLLELIAQRGSIIR